MSTQINKNKTLRSKHPSVNHKKEDSTTMTCQISSNSSNGLRPERNRAMLIPSQNPSSQTSKQNEQHNPLQETCQTGRLMIEKPALTGSSSGVANGGREPTKASLEDTGLERPNRHRIEVAGWVWIPDIWGQEGMMNEWIDCSALDASLVPGGIESARAALAEEGRRPSSRQLRFKTDV